MTIHSDKKGRLFISLTGLALTVFALLLLNILRLYLVEKYPQYLPDMRRVRSIPEIVTITIMAVVAVLYFIFIIFILPAWYRSFKYVINDNRIVSYSGVLSRTYRIMRIDSIQHATVLSLPFSKHTSFNFIRLSALGGVIIMCFLSDEDCKRFMELIDRSAEKEAKETKQVSAPDLADIIHMEMRSLAFFDDNNSGDEFDPDQIDFFPDEMQMTFDDKNPSVKP